MLKILGNEDWETDKGNINSTQNILIKQVTNQKLTLNKSIDVVKPTGRDCNITRKEIKYENTKHYPIVKEIAQI